MYAMEASGKERCRSQMPRVKSLTYRLKKCFVFLLIFSLLGLACKVFTPVPTQTQIPFTPTPVETISAPAQTQSLFTPTVVEEISSPTSTQIPPTSVEATASPAFLATPLAALFPKLEVIDAENVSRLQVVAELPISTDVVCFSADGKKLAVAGLQIWDLTSGQLSLGLDHYGVTYLSFSPDGKFLFSRASYHPASNDAAILWDLSSGQRVRVLDVENAAISPDWRVLATLPTMPYDMSSGPYEEFIQLTDFKRGIELGRLKDPSNSIFDIHFSPDGSKLAMKLIGVENAEIVVWDVRSMQMIASLDELLWLDFSADGEFAAGTSWRPEIKIFETRTWTEVASLSGDKDVNFNSPVFTPDSSMVAGAFGGQIRLFKTGTWKELVTLSEPGIPNYLAFSPDGRLLASYGGSQDKVLLWGVVP